MNLSRCLRLLLVLLLPAAFSEPAGAQPPAAAQPPAQDAQPQRRIRYWTTNWSFRDIDVGTLTRRLARIGIAAPADLDGDISVNLSVSIPINALADGTAYRINGTLESSRLRIESAALRMRTDVNYVDGVAALDNLSGDFYASPAAVGEPDAGSFSGRASLRLAGVGLRTAAVELDVSSLQLSVPAAAVDPDSPYRIDARGVADGRLRWSAPVESLTDLAAWDAEGRLAIANLSIDRHPPLNVDTGPVRIAASVIDLPQFRADVAGVAGAGLGGSFQAELAGNRPWSMQLQSQQVPIDSLAAVFALGEVPGTAGNLSVSGEAQGTLTPLAWQVDAELQSPNLSVYGVRLGEVNHRLVSDASRFELTSLSETAERHVIRSVSAEYEITPEQIDLRELDADLFDGSLRGNVVWSRDAVGTHQANLAWSNLHLRWDAGSVIAGVPGIVSLSTEGRTAWQVPADRLNIPADHSLRAVVEIEELAVAGLAVGNGTLMVRAIDGELALRGEGELLGGTFRVDSATEIPADVDFTGWWAEPRFAWPPLSGTLQLRAVSLTRVGNVIRLQTGDPAAGRDWQGRGDASIDFSVPPGDFDALTTRGSVRVSDFVISRRPITPALAVDFRTRDNLFLIDRMRGTYAGGSVDAVGQWPLTGGGRMDVTFSRVDLGRALLPLSSDADQWFDGELSGRLRMTGNRVLRMSGSLEGRSVIAGGFPLGTVRSGVTGTLSDIGGWQVRFPNVGGSVGGGRISGTAVLTSSFAGGAFDLQSRWTAQQVDFEDMIGGLGARSSVGRGNLTATLVLDGRNIRGVNDLVGRFDGRLGGTAASAVPGLSRARAFLGPLAGGSLTFTDGLIRGRIGRGLAQVDELALRSDRLRVVADGSIRLDNQRILFDAVAATGDFTAQNLVLGAVARQVVLAVAPPAAMLLSINRLISDRTVYLQVGGTLRSPTVRIRPLETAGQNLLRYMIREATGLPDLRATSM